MSDQCEPQFYLKGEAFSTMESDTPCAAWMVPPTDLPRPALIVEEAEYTMGFKDRVLKYQAPVLRFPTSQDDADLTPVLVKVIEGEAYLVLMRGHLRGELLAAKKGVKRAFPGNEHIAEENWPAGDSALRDLGLIGGGGAASASSRMLRALGSPAKKARVAQGAKHLTK